MHRLPPAGKTSAELLTFRREDWVAADDGSSWSPAFRRCQVARYAWVETHSDSDLGDMLDVLRGEVQVKRGSLGVGAVMAMHRKPVGTPTPPELLVFRLEDWAAPDDGAEDWRGYRRWQDARRAYSKAHPDSELGSALDQLRFERRCLTSGGLSVRRKWV